MDAGAGHWAGFKKDLSASFRAWLVAPVLPLVSVALTVAGYAPEAWLVFLTPLLVFSVGWVGTERIWYMRIFRGESFAIGELRRMTFAFFWRYFFLGLLAALAMAPVAIVLALRAGTSDWTNGLDPVGFVALSLVTVVIDFALTFATPALAFSTRSATDALRIGLRMLREHWPRTAWYALMPPLAVVVLLRVAEAQEKSRVVVILSVFGTLLNLWFKGATAAFYLRNVEVGHTGAAFLERPVRVAAPD